ncbi:uncharacterized protein Z519_06692 [Cladophialophora bantiana CBS 173.52]|uniref:Nitroreductase domain-containing protein n=1 Tax=Cladophialophora bantiana (strain ATCC 10958 / CBS 173.52 / CDC B-1940 / NIH 8579) TaxID=1442370 RepID=A0A0D2HHU8_CLAB1|nr:uncharacterized protein Z519_06692 [Cladophialophora bantiana CBS 173.52]KIW92843.1 hypothetical protein Z519_06692 [Cladophialophora bantiana CBS 173.52]
MSNLRASRPLSVSQAVSQRHSIHSFIRDRPVPRETLEEVFRIAQNSASNFNIQPWEVKVITGEKLSKVQEKLVNNVQSGKPMQIPDPPAKFRDRVEKQGSVLHGEGFGIAREDKTGRREVLKLNFRSYGAPCMALFCMDKGLATADVASMGIYLENVILLLWEQGLGSIPQMTMAGYPEVFKEEIGLSEDLQIICGLGIGYPDEDANVVKVRMPKRRWEEHVTFWE